jgi:preprotein translocase SecE subunit
MVAASKTTVEVAPEPPAKAGWSVAALTDYLRAVRAEMGRVTWPGKRELQAATMVVMMTLIVFSAYMGVLDAILKKVIR